MGDIYEMLEQAESRIAREDEFEAQLRSRHSGGGGISQMLADAEVRMAIRQRRAQRAYAAKAPEEIRSAAQQLLGATEDRWTALDVWRGLGPEQRQEVMRVAPGVGQEMGYERPGFIGRMGQSVGAGIAGVSQPIMELVGAGGTDEEIEVMRYLDAIRSQEFAPARADDPWYQRGPLQALEMVPHAMTMIGGGAASQAYLKGTKVSKGMLKAFGSSHKARQATRIMTAMPGITAASYPAQYAQEKDALKALGVTKNPKLIAGLTAAVVGSLESIVPNPLKAGPVPLTQGVMKAVRAHVANVLKNYPGELSEEGFQGLASGLGHVVATYLDENAPQQGLGAAFAEGWEQTKEAALPLAFLLGVPAAAGATRSAVTARRLSAMLKKDFITTDDAKELGLAPEDAKNRKTRKAAVERMLAELQYEPDAGITEPPPEIRPDTRDVVKESFDEVREQEEAEIQAEIPSATETETEAEKEVPIVEVTEPTVPAAPEGTLDPSATTTATTTQASPAEEKDVVPPARRTELEAMPVRELRRLAPKGKKSRNKAGLIDAILEREAEVDSEVDRIESEAKSIAEQQAEAKQEAMRYQGSEKNRLEDELGYSRGTFDLPYEKWASIRDANPNDRAQVAAGIVGRSDREETPAPEDVPDREELPAYKRESKLSESEKKHHGEMRQKARERELELVKNRDELQTQHDATRRNAHKKRGKLKDQIRDLNRQIGALRSDFDRHSAELRLDELEDALENATSEVHREAGFAEKARLKIQQWNKVGEQEDSRQMQRMAYDRAAEFDKVLGKHEHNLQAAFRKEASKLADDFTSDELDNISERAWRDFSVTSKSTPADLVKAESERQKDARFFPLSETQAAFLSDEQKEAFQDQMREAAQGGKDWRKKYDAVVKKAEAANEKSRKANEKSRKADEKGKADEAEQKAREQEKIEAAALRDRRNRARIANADDRFWKESRKRAGKLKPVTSIRQGESGGVLKTLTINENWAIVEEEDDGGKTTFQLTHSPTGKTAGNAYQKLIDAKGMYQFLEDVGLSLNENVKSDGNMESEYASEVGKALKAYNAQELSQASESVQQAALSTVATAESDIQADLVLDAYDLGMYDGEKPAFKEVGTGRNKRKVRIPLPPGKLRDNTGSIKELAAEVPEFAYNPVFTVSDEGKLVFKDGFKYSFEPAMFNLHPSEVKPGMTVGVNLADIGIQRPAPEKVVQAVLKREFSVKSRGKKGGYVLKRLGRKDADALHVVGSGQNWEVTQGIETVDGKRAKELLDGIAWIRSEQVEKNEEAAGVEETPKPVETPVGPLARYAEIKKANPGSLLLFRMGDFYELFHDDAKVAAKTLGLTLASRDKGSPNPIPMAGFPYHQLDAYLQKLIQAGFRAAIVEQVEEQTLVSMTDGRLIQTFDRVVGKPKTRMPSGNAMAAMTEGDSYQPYELEPETTGQTKPESGRAGRDEPSLFRGTRRTVQPTEIVRDVVGLASPAHVSDVSREGSHVMREEMGRASQWDEAAREALRVMERKFWSMSRDAAYEFIDRLEAGKKQETGELEEIAQAIRAELDKGRDRLQRLGMLREYYENYFPHLWKDVGHAQETLRNISAGKPWRSRGFLRERTHITHKDGRDAGLVPITDNPIEMVLLRLHQINKCVSRTNIMNELKQSGLMRFVPVNFGDQRSYVPSGYEYYDDPAFEVVADPSITMEEAYDKLLVQQLSSVLHHMGVSHKRVAKMSHETWGVSQGKKIKTRFAGPVSVLAHELGHQIGDTWGLYEYLTTGDPVKGRLFKTGKRAGQESEADARRKRVQMKRELRALADLRVEGQGKDVAEGTKQYRRKAAEKEAVILEAWLAAPEKMADVAPMVTAAWKDFLQANEPVSPLLNLDRSVVLGTREQVVPQAGILTLGKWAMPREVAQMVKNMLSPGLRSNRNIAVKGLYDLARKMGNAMNQASLSLSGFHGLNVLTDATASQIGIAMQQLERGQFGRAYWNLVTAPAAGVVGTIRGGELVKATRSDLKSLSPEMREFVESLIRAGGRASMDPVYHNHALRGVVKSIRALKYGEGIEKASAAVKLPAQMILSGLEMTTKPIMEWMVPRLKLAVFEKMLEDIHARAAVDGLSDFEMREEMTQAWDSVDNRLGQLNYDNLFWNQYVKDVSMLAVRSVGWNLGSLREYGGAVVDAAAIPARYRRGDRIITRRMGYAIGATIEYATIGALYMWARGDAPEELKDYFFPKTGRLNPDGSPERLSAPTYAKDWVGWTTRPGTTLMHKLHPMWGTMATAWRNESYYGVKIRHEDDPWLAQLADTMKHVGESFVPFSIKNLGRFLDAGEDPTIAVPMALSGITSAPAYISRSPAQKLAYSLTIGNMRRGSRTTEQAEASQHRKELVRRLRAGGVVRDEEITQYSRRQVELIEEEAKKTDFQVVVGRLHRDQTMKVWDVATDKEKSALRDMLVTRFIHNASEYNVETVKDVEARSTALQYLAKLGVSSFSTAQQALEKYFETHQTSKRAKSGGLKPSYVRRLDVLRTLYAE